MRVFLTGANGFIGGAVASALIADGHSVRGLVRNKAKADAVAAHGVESISAGHRGGDQSSAGLPRNLVKEGLRRLPPKCDAFDGCHVTWAYP
jgi:nucleoside-diphosphate-sugar epimerase